MFDASRIVYYHHSENKCEDISDIAKLEFEEAEKVIMFALPEDIMPSLFTYGMTHEEVIDILRSTANNIEKRITR